MLLYDKSNKTPICHNLNSERRKPVSPTPNKGRWLDKWWQSPMWTTPLAHIAPIREEQRGARLHLQYSRQSNEPHLNGHSDCISRQTQRNTVRLRTNPIQRMWYATMAPQVVTYNEKLPWMSGRWNNRGEGKRGEKNEPEKGKKTHTQARKQWFYPNVSVGFRREKNGVCSFLLLSRRVRCCCCFFLNTHTPLRRCSHDRSLARTAAARRAPAGERRWNPRGGDVTVRM